MEAHPLSSSVTIDWRAIREQDRQACIALRAELAQLRAQSDQLRLRSATAAAASRQPAVPVHRVARPRAAADRAELSRRVGEARAGLAGSAAALDRVIGELSQARDGRPAGPSWTTQPVLAGVPAPAGRADIDLDRLSGEQAARVPAASGEREAAAAAAAEADAVLAECRLRCPEADLTGLTALRAELGAGGPSDRAVSADLRVRAARIIQQVKRDDAAEAQRQGLFVLAEEVLPAERAALRRRVADAPPEDLPRLDHEVAAAVQRASTERSRAEAVSALELSLSELGYDVQGGFDALLPQAAAARPSPDFLVAASPHSADHGLRVRVGTDQLYLSVVRRAGTAGGDTQAADTRLQERTCADLAAAVSAAADKGVQIILGNAQAPGRPAPELDGSLWPAAGPASTAAAGEAGAGTADDAQQERSRAWAAAQQQLRAAGPQARSRRPGS
jgi:hypothetical protein